MSRKFKEGLEMSNWKLADEELKEIEATALGWGKLLAAEAFPDGPGLEGAVTPLDEIMRLWRSAGCCLLF